MAWRARCRRSRQLLWSARAAWLLRHSARAAACARRPRSRGGRGDRSGAADDRKEDEWLGDSRDRLAERAKEAGREQVEKARAAAGAAYSAAREEAERQGLTLEGGKAAAESAAETVRHKTERVAEAATEAAKTEAERQHRGHVGSKDA